MANRFLTGSELARLCGVSRQAITAAAKSGTLWRDPQTDRFDVQNDANLAYIEAKLADADIGSDAAADDDTAEDADPSIRRLKSDKLIAEIARTQEQQRKLAFANEVTIGRLVPVDMLRPLAGGIGQSVRSILLTIPDRLAPNVVAAVRSGQDEQQVRGMIENELDAGLERFVRSIETAIDAGLGDYIRSAGVPVESDDDDEEVDA